MPTEFAFAAVVGLQITRDSQAEQAVASESKTSRRGSFVITMNA